MRWDEFNEFIPADEWYLHFVFGSFDAYDVVHGFVDALFGLRSGGVNALSGRHKLQHLFARFLTAQTFALLFDRI